MVKVKKNNRNFEVKKYIKKTTPALMSLLVATSCLNGVHYPKNAYASGVTQKINTGDGGVKVLYANNGLNPLNFSIGDAAIYGHKNVEDVVKISVTFPKNNGQNDYGPESKKVHIKYEFNSNKGAYWAGRPFYWFSLPKNVKEPSNIKITNASGNSDSIQNWRQWTTNTRFVASRYQNMQDAIAQNEGHPHDWGRFNDRTEEYQKGFNGSFNYQFNRMLDEQDGGWFDENGGTRNFAKSIRNNSKSIYIDWEPRGDGKVTIEVDTEVMFPLKSNTLDFAAGAFSVLGNIRIANMQTVTTPHYITYAEKYALDTPEIMEVENPNNIGEEKKKEIIKKLKEEQKNKDKTKYLVEENNNFGYKQIEVKDNGDTTITFRDLSQQTIAGSRLVTKHVPYKDRFGIKIPQTTEVKNTSKLEEKEIKQVKEAIFNANKDNKEFIKGIGGNDKKDTAITVTDKGEATIKYVDKTEHKIEANKLVTRYIPLAEKYEPLISVTTGVVNKDSLTQEEQKKVKKVLVDINKQANHAIMDALENGEESIVVDSKGKATLTYKDKSTDTIAPNSLIYQIPKMNERYEPNLIARLGSDNPTDLKEAEKKQLKEALWKANTNLHDKLKGKDKDKSITIEKDGKATFTYDDDTKDVIPGEYLVYKKGEKASPVTRLVQNGDKKYYLTPIVVADMNKLNGNNFADALRRFLFDNYTWTGKEENFEKEVKKPFLTVTGGYLPNDNRGWLENKLRQDVKDHNIKPKNETRNIELPNKIVRIGYEPNEKYLDFRFLRGWQEDQYFKIEKEKLFITNGGAFDADKAKKEADDIIDKLKNEKGLSKDEADKLKKEIEDAKGNGTLNQDKINEIIKKANEQAKKDSEAEKLKKAKDEAEKELKKLTDIKNEDKKGAENNIKQADTIDKVQKALDEAKKKDQEEKAKKEAEALLKKQKEEAKKVINSLNNLEKGEKEPYTKSNGSIDQAKDEKAIQDLVEKAKAQDKANADKKALDEAKKKAKEIIGKLEHLSTKEKEAYTKQTTGSVDKANTKEDVDKQIKEAQKKDADNKKALDQAKNKAKEEIGKLKHLSPKEKEDFGKEIDKAKDQNGIDQVINKAKEQDKKNAKDQAIKDIKNSGLSEEEKKQAEKEIEQAGSTDEIDKKAEEHLQKAAEEKAKKEKEEADKLKEEYKQKIEDTKGLDQSEKQDYKKQIDQATSKGQMDSIVQMAQAKAKQKQAKEEVGKLSHLNNAQIKDIQEKIDNLISDQDINEEVAKARYLDGKMDSLQKLVKKADEADIKERLAKAQDPEKTNFNKALAEAKKVEKKDGTYADDSTVSDLIKKLEDSINALDKTKPQVKAEVSKEALKKAIEDAKKLKNTDLYKNSDENKRKEFDEKLTAAETENTKQDSTDESVAKALQDLQNAQNSLNGTFKLEKENGDALISVSDANDTEIKEDKDKEAIKAKVKGIPEGAVVTYSKIKDKKVTVTVVKDNVSQTIDIPVKGDVAAPTITVDGATPMAVNDYTVEVTKMENFPELTVKAEDDNLDESTLDVKPDVNWLEFDKTTKKIKLKAGNTSIPKTATNAMVTISVKDKAGNKAAKIIHVTVKSQSDKYKPVVTNNQAVRKVKGEKAGTPQTYVKNTDATPAFPTGTEYKWKNNGKETDDITLDTAGDSIKKEVQVKYPDGSTSIVEVTFKVVEDISLNKKDQTPALVSFDTNSNNAEVTKEEDKNRIKEKITGIPENAKVTYSKVTEKSGKKVITVSVEKDGVTKEIDIEVKGDTTSPQISLANENPVVYKAEKFENIAVTVTDENIDDSKIEVEKLPEWLEYDKQNKVIKLKTGKTEVPKDASTTEIEIKATDKVGNTNTKKVTITVKNQADKYKPQSITDGVSNVQKTQGEPTSKPETYVKDKEKLPSGTTYKWKNETGNPKLDTLGEVEKEIEITYPDGSKATVKVKFNVIDKKPDVPTVTAKDNGDVTIKPAPNTDKISVTYTPTNENAEKTVEIEKDNDGKWKIPAEFSQNDSGEITIPDTVTKNNTAVKVKASKGTSGYTTEKSTTITAKELQEVKTPVTIAGSDNKDTVVTENNRKLILDSLTSDQKGEANASIEKDAKIKEEAGKKYVEVKLEFKDKSTKVIKVPVVGDSTAPQVEVSSNNPTVYKKEGFTEIKVNATDSNLADKPIEVQGLPNWLQYDENAKTIKFANGTTEVPTDATTTTVKVIAKDKVGNTTTKEIVITVKSQSDKYSPETLTSDGSKIKKSTR